MPKYAYVATRPDGTSTKGVESFVSSDAAQIALYERELRNIKVEEKKSFLQFELTPKRVKREEVMHLSRQMAAFIRAGIPILEAVHTLGAEAENISVKRMMVDVEEGLRTGDTLSECFDRHPKVFPAFYRGILRSAELTGNLDTVLDQLAGYLERDLEARRKVKAALIYPSVIASMAVVTIAVLSIFVLPRFKSFFETFDAKLPLPTRILLGVTNFLGAWWWAIIMAAVVTAVVFTFAVRTTRGRHLRDRIALRTPVVGDTIQFALVERFCRLLSSMILAGVTLPEAMRVTSEALRNLVYVRALDGVIEAMREGEGIAGPVQKTKLFPPTATQMMRVGEDTGTLDVQLAVAAEYYERELDYKIKKLTALFEPAVIVAMGLLVGFVAVALVTAMYGIFRQVQI